MKRRRTLAWLLSATGLLAAPQLLRAQGPAVLVEVWKSPSCGCCKDQGLLTLKLPDALFFKRP
jgi:hypothetical protein